MKIFKNFQVALKNLFALQYIKKLIKNCFWEEIYLFLKKKTVSVNKTSFEIL